MKVALDVDGVLADFMLSLCEQFGETLPRITDWDSEVIVKYFPVVKSDKAFWGGLKVLNHPTMLTFNFDYYVTSIPDDIRDARISWLKKNGFPDKPVIVAEDKVTACRELGVTILIDDKPDTMRKFQQEEDLIGIQYIPYYSDMPVFGDYEITCLTEVNGIISQLQTQVS